MNQEDATTRRLDPVRRGDRGTPAVPDGGRALVTSRTRIDGMTADVREAFPDAQFVLLSSSDQDLYGYELDAVLLGPDQALVASGRTFETLCDAARDYLGWLDWGCFQDREDETTFRVDLHTGQIARS